MGGARKYVGLKGRNAIEPPRRINEFLNKLLFGGALRLILVEELLSVALVGGRIFSGQQHSTS
jgi:hypothetical protein